ncbi:uncharacterized protein Dmul_20440 [Desulfococcus multivorans]|nr:uncharacterized protein Dmul_20440 [Desulfococcus multivorans]
MAPQHPVSPGPGIPWRATPDTAEGADSSFFRRLLPQSGQDGGSSDDLTRISQVFPQSPHKNSNSGMAFLR